MKKSPKQKQVKAWAVVAGEYEMLGRGQGFTDMFYSQSGAEQWLSFYRGDAEKLAQMIKLTKDWHVVPIIITLPEGGKTKKK